MTAPPGRAAGAWRLALYQAGLALRSMERGEPAAEEQLSISAESLVVVQRDLG